MKLHIDNPNCIVRSAFFHITPYAVNIIINTDKRHRYADWSESCLDTYTLGFNGDTDDEGHDSVKLISETPEEVEMLDWFPFVNCCKDQLHYLLC